MIREFIITCVNEKDADQIEREYPNSVLVRCKDCKHYDANYYDDQGTCYLDGWGVHADFFCANGERRESE